MDFDWNSVGVGTFVFYVSTHKLVSMTNGRTLYNTLIYRVWLKLKSTVSSHLASPKRFPLYPLADLFIPTPIRLLWEAFSQAAITARRQTTHIFLPLSFARFLFIHLSELGHRGDNKNAQVSNDDSIPGSLK